MATHCVMKKYRLNYCAGRSCQLYSRLCFDPDVEKIKCLHQNKHCLSLESPYCCHKIENFDYWNHFVSYDCETITTIRYYFEDRHHILCYAVAFFCPPDSVSISSPRLNQCEDQRKFQRLSFHFHLPSYHPR
jgi:hypothetical protein